MNALVPSAILIVLPFACLAQAQPSNDQLDQLRQQVTAQQKQLDEQRRTLEAQQKKLDSLSAGGAASAPASTADADNPPFSFRIGGAEFAPGGFMDFSTVWRSTNIGSGVATSFAAVPMGNTSAGRMQEFRSSAANSRITLTITERPTRNVLLTGYLEADFYGNQPASLFVTSNSNTLRMRHFWVSAQRGKWEFLGGQTWTLVTPNRAGTSQVSSNVFVGLGEDSNYMPGLAWARPGQIRVTYHPNSKWSIAASVENPQQYVTTGTTLPAFAATQVDNGSLSTAPNVRPDLVAKVAYDTRVSGKALHFEIAGYSRQFRVSPAPDRYFNKQAVGGSAATVVQVTNNLRLIATGLYGSGGGRYLTGLGPDLVVGPDGSISPVHSIGGTAGFEYTVDANSQVFGYYGATYFNRNYTVLGPNTYLGFGHPGSNSANRQFQEPSLGYYYTFWKSPKYGSLQIITEYAYLTRAPWYVAPYTPSTAHAHMVFGSIRFTLPQGAPREPARAK